MCDLKVCRYKAGYRITSKGTAYSRSLTESREVCAQHIVAAFKITRAAFPMFGIEIATTIEKI